MKSSYRSLRKWQYLPPPIHTKKRKMVNRQVTKIDRPRKGNRQDFKTQYSKEPDYLKKEHYGKIFFMLYIL